MSLCPSTERKDRKQALRHAANAKSHLKNLASELYLLRANSRNDDEREEISALIDAVNLALNSQVGYICQETLKYSRRDY